MGQVICCCFKKGKHTESVINAEYSAIRNNLIESETSADEERSISKKAQYLNDAKKDDDDYPAITPAELNKLDRYAQFERKFPFYRIDANGF